MTDTPKLLANENFPAPAVRALRERGIDVLWVRECMAGADDILVMARARAEGRWLLTYDRDYGELVYSRHLPAPPAVIYFRQEAYPPPRPAALVLELLERADRIAGAFVVVSESSVRLKRLPESAANG